jgi:hypothetical protein
MKERYGVFQHSGDNGEDICVVRNKGNFYEKNTTTGKKKKLYFISEFIWFNAIDSMPDLLAVRADEAEEDGDYELAEQYRMKREQVYELASKVYGLGRYGMAVWEIYSALKKLATERDAIRICTCKNQFGW